MIISKLFGKPQNSTTEKMTLPEMVAMNGFSTISGQTVTVEKSKTIATAYRCGNIISDDVAKMPLQMFKRVGPQQIIQIQPDSMTRNLAYLLEVNPNQWHWTPFTFRKAVIQWLLYWGNGYIWTPPTWPRQMFVLPGNMTYPVFDVKGNLWYRTIFNPDGYQPANEMYLPAVEVLHLLINPDNTGFNGRSVLTFARESMGRQLGAYETQSKFYSQGLNAGGILWTSGEVNKEARKKIRDEYESTMTGSANAYRLAVLDPKITKFEKVTMNATDMQFLESINATDVDIANFFGLPIYKLNMGKQSYQSNEQQNIDYLTTTLDPYLVQWEQAARTTWLSELEQNSMYFKFIRESILRTDAATRAAYLEKKILSGQLTPNEARSIDDMSGYSGGDQFYMPSNIGKIGDNQV